MASRMRGLQLPGRTCARCTRKAAPLRRLATSADRGERSHSEVIFTGIQPTGTPHLGNYLGLFLPFLNLQRTSPTTTPIYLAVVGLHAITLPQDPKQLRQDRLNMLASLLAAGVDPDRTCLYLQEDVPEHTELAWYFNTLAPVGKLQRMTTWKSRLATSRNANSVDEVSEADLRLGLLSYPVLQAADIALYKATHVPVGEDQTQHLELARDLIQTYNTTFSPTFPLPQTLVVPSKRVLSLRDPSAKMSKSAPLPASRIGILDSPATIAKNLRSAVTDSMPGVSYDPEARPGVSNLLTIWSALDEGGRTPERLAEEHAGWGMGQLKSRVADVVTDALTPVRERFARIKEDEGYVREVARKNGARAREIASQTIAEVKTKMGLGPL